MRKDRRTRQQAAVVIDRCLIYIRVSGYEQAREGLSLASQLEDCRRYAHSRGWVVVAEFTDVMKGTRDDRPQYQAMLELARQLRAEGRAVAITVKWLHRLGRKVKESVDRRDEFKTLGIAVHSVSEGGEVSDLVANVMASVAEYEVQQLGDRVAAVWDTAVGRGWYKTAPSPWGYLWRAAEPEERAEGSPKSVLDVDRIAEPYVVELFARVADGASMHGLQRWLATLPPEIRGRRAMSRPTIADMLRNAVYVGKALHGDADVLSRQTMRWPAIIDDDLWTRVQERMDAQAALPRKASGRFLLTGFLACPKCGGKMRGQGGGSRYRCAGSDDANSTVPSCWQTADAPRVDRLVLDQVASVLDAMNDRDVQQALKTAWREVQAIDTSGARTNQRHALEARIATATKNIDAATDLLIQGTLGREAYDRAVSRNQADKDLAFDQLARLAPAPKVKSLPPIESVLKQAGGWSRILLEGDIDAQREVLTLLISSVVPQRVKQAQYRVAITWSALGEQLSEAALFSAQKVA